MRIFALSDPHLSLGTPGKSMDVFGPQWVDHTSRIAANWCAVVRAEDLVLVPGDISWAMRMDGAEADLSYLHDLPGTKVICKGNHDYWWASRAKVRKALPESILAVQADSVQVGDVVIGGTRLWDLPDVSFAELIDWTPNPISKGYVEATPDEVAQDRKIFERECQRLDNALTHMCGRDNPGGLRIVLTHYPPVSADLEPNDLTRRFEKHGVDHVVFGHLHSLKEHLEPRPFGELNGVHYHLTACDHIGFIPVRIDAT